MYIGFAHKKNPMCKIILFTERVNILADLFDFSNVNKSTLNYADSYNVKLWKQWGICDLTNFNLIDRVTVKKQDWVELLNNASKPTLLVINRAYLTIQNKKGLSYNQIKNLDLVLHDECHNVSSNQCFAFLKFIKSVEIKNNLIEKNKIKFDANNKKIKCAKNLISKSIPIVGFSATPLRTGKTKVNNVNVLNKDRLLEIYGKKNGKLNLISDYNMMYAISEKLILPPKFYWYEIENYQTKTEGANNLNIQNIEQISKTEIDSVLNILNKLIEEMPNKKLIAWCGTIQICDEWYKKFNQFKDSYSNIKNILTFKDYSKKTNNSEKGYDEFKNIESNGIMFCAQKHREGSDIKKLDGCIFLDKVKNRSPIPFIQSIGRVLRKEKSPNSKKNNGIIIDGVMRDNEEYEKNIVDKILGYYFALNDLANLDEIVDVPSAYEKYSKLISLVEFDLNKKIIKLKLDDSGTNIEINCKELNWGNIVKNFDSIIEKKVNLDPKEKLKAEFEKLKKKAIKIKKKYGEDNLVEKWNLYAKQKKMSDDIKITYHEIWKDWYDFYSIDKNKFPKTKRDWYNKCKKYGLNSFNYKENVLMYPNMPEIPEDVYNDFVNLTTELSNIQLVKKVKVL